MTTPSPERAGPPSDAGAAAVPMPDEAGHGVGSPPPAAVAGPSAAPPTYIRTFRWWIHDYFLGDDPTFGLALVPYCFLSMLLFTRHPTKTNFIFDEQEALLANPYVRSIADPEPKFRWIDAFYRDFWGLGPDRSIGSYRPVPNLVWRALWGMGARDQTPFLHHWVNVLLHGLNGALVCVLAFRLTRRRSTAWLAGACFTASAVLTEAVSGVVGIADVLGATGALLALLALALRMPWMGIGVFFATLFGLYSKESALCCVPLVPLTALLTAQVLHPPDLRPTRRWARAAVALVATAAAFVLYVEARRRMFPAPLPAELSVDANAHKSAAGRTFAAILRWYAQPSLPKDPLNNPLVSAPPPLRIAGALRVYFRGLVQVVFPHTLSGDYSAPQEPVPSSLFFPESLLGALAMALPFPLAGWLGIRAYRKWKAELGAAELVHVGERPYLDVQHRVPAERRVDLRPVVGAALVWVAVSYFPVSNIPVLLPTVRAERFWYFPVIGTSLLLAIAFSALLGEKPSRDDLADPHGIEPARSLGAAPFRVAWVLIGAIFVASGVLEAVLAFMMTKTALLVVAGASIGMGAFLVLRGLRSRERTPVRRTIAVAGILAFFVCQGLAARNHANDYADDLAFWDATRRSVPRSAKAHLNYSVMKGARGDLAARLDANTTALELAPQWPMASIYLGDTLCRLHRAQEAWPHYVRGFELAPNDVNLIALALQCLWDEKVLAADSPIRAELDTLKEKFPGSWLEYLGRDVLEHGEEHNGVDPKHRPRGYNEGPKE